MMMEDERVQQRRGQRNIVQTTRVMYDGRRQTILAWAIEVDIPPHRIITRLRHGWSTERALTEPVNKNGPGPTRAWSPPEDPPGWRTRAVSELSTLMAAWRVHLSGSR